jgi:hypothetical protein
MPTRRPRITVTNDPELAAALSRVDRFFPDAPAARVVRDLAIKGAEAIEREEDERGAAIERLIAFSTERSGPIDWEFLESGREVAWSD